MSVKVEFDQVDTVPNEPEGEQHFLMCAPGAARSAEAITTSCAQCGDMIHHGLLAPPKITKVCYKCVVKMSHAEGEATFRFADDMIEQALEHFGLEPTEENKKAMIERVQRKTREMLGVGDEDAK